MINPHFTHASIGRAHVALDGHILKVNQALCDLWGLTLEEVLSPDFRWQHITPEPDLSLDLDLLRDLFDKKIDSYQLDKRYQQPDGSYRWARLTVWRVQDDSGKVLFYDITVANIGFDRRLSRSIERLADQIERM